MDETISPTSTINHVMTGRHALLEQHARVSDGVVWRNGFYIEPTGGHYGVECDLHGRGRDRVVGLFGHAQ
jgi:hypothetical protein